MWTRPLSRLTGLIRALTPLAMLPPLFVPLATQADTVFPDPREPPSVSSVNGVTTITLTAEARAMRLGPATIPGLVFNGDYAGPVLHVRPGENLAIHLVNRLDEPTNLHFHGIQTTPLGNADNAHIVVPPGGIFDYLVPIPATQPPGLYWYHPHIHGTVEKQVMGGLSGALIVDGFAAQFPDLKGIAEHLFVIKEFEFPDSDDPITEGELHGRLITINAQTGVTIRMRPYETQLWQMVSQTPNQVMQLTVPGHRFRRLGEDGVAGTGEVQLEVLRITPGGRMAVLVDAPGPGKYDLIARNVLTGGARDRVLGRVIVEGEPAVPVPPIHQFPGREDLRRLTADTKRTIVFTQNAEAEKYFLDGRLFDHDRMDVRVPLGSIQDWTLKNESGDFHEFHIHQVHFQVIEVNGQPVPFEGYRDLVRIPEQGTVTIRLAFTQPQIVGAFFYHCHVLKHEDNGMMANIEVYDPAASQKPRRTLLSPMKTWLARLIRSDAVEFPLPICGQ